MRSRVLRVSRRDANLRRHELVEPGGNEVTFVWDAQNWTNRIASGCGTLSEVEETRSARQEVRAGANKARH